MPRAAPTGVTEDHSFISNQDLAGILDRIAELLELREANPFRVGSYRGAALEIRALPDPVWRLREEGGRGSLQDIPGVGEGIAAVLDEVLDTGSSRLLERLEEEEASPEVAFRRLPGVGPTLAARIHDELGVHTLEDLEQAAHDGRLARVRGVGTKTAAGIRDALAGILGRQARRRTAHLRAARHAEPPVELLLSVDAEYRALAEADALPRIAPRRFNTGGARWLPILHVERDGWDLTALFSNTGRAHKLGRTSDWVVIYYHRDGEDGQCTVVTSRAAGLGDDVVRGREPECRALEAGTIAGSAGSR